MPDFLTKNLAVVLSVLVISAGGVVSYSKQGSEIEYLKDRVGKLEGSQAEVVALLSRIDKRLGLISCRLDTTTCLGEK